MDETRIAAANPTERDLSIVRPRVRSEVTQSRAIEPSAEERANFVPANQNGARRTRTLTTLRNSYWTRGAPSHKMRYHSAHQGITGWSPVDRDDSLDLRLVHLLKPTQET